jgi:diamine N-acetyltransferase
MKYQITQIDIQSIRCIKPLWEKLRKIHYNDSHCFKDYFRSLTFEKRCEKFARLSAEDIFIEGVFLPNRDAPVGYCVSTAENSTGEIDSIFIEEQYRKNGVGARLIHHSLQWLQEKGCTTIRVGVAEGHDSVLGFYRKIGFYPRMIILEFKEKTKRKKKP